MSSDPLEFNPYSLCLEGDYFDRLVQRNSEFVIELKYSGNKNKMKFVGFFDALNNLVVDIFRKHLKNVMQRVTLK